MGVEVTVIVVVVADACGSVVGVEAGVCVVVMVVPDAGGSVIVVDVDVLGNVVVSGNGFGEGKECWQVEVHALLVDMLVLHVRHDACRG